MKVRFFLISSLTLVVFMQPVAAQKRVDNQKGSTKNLEIPQCANSIGTVSLTDGEGQGWTYYGLGAPSTLIKTFIARSGCFKMVDRGAGLAALQKEQALAAEGGLQRGSNVGAGQVKAADYVIVADVANADSNAGGGGVGGAVGGIVGGRLGGLLGGMKTKHVQAQTVLTVMNVRTSEIEATAEGSADKKDISFLAGGGWGFGGVVGGGYEDTDIGKVVTYAFLDAYRQIVTQLGGLSDNAGADAPKEAFVVSVESTSLRRSPSSSSTAVRSLRDGDLVYPTGAKEDLWWEVEDENGNVGWIENPDLRPLR